MKNASFIKKQRYDTYLYLLIVVHMLSKKKTNANICNMKFFSLHIFLFPYCRDICYTYICMCLLYSFCNMTLSLSVCYSNKHIRDEKSNVRKRWPWVNKLNEIENKNKTEQKDSHDKNYRRIFIIIWRQWKNMKQVL